MAPLSQIAESFSAMLPFGLDLLLRATIVLAIVQLLLVALERRSAASRHFVVTLGLAAVIALPLLMLALPDARLAVLPESPAIASAEGPVPGDGTLRSWKSGSAATGATDDFTEVARAISSTGIANHRALSIATTVLWIGDNWQLLALLALTLVPLALLARIFIGTIAVWSVARRAVPADAPWMSHELAQAARRLSVRRPIRMLLSDRINVPLVWGFSKPVLILPSSARTWTRDRFRVVILHEVAHVRRFDVLSLMTGRLATALYWFHPLSWMLERAGRRECERACDDLVLRTGTRASDYADHLLGIAAGEDLAEGYASVTLAMARPSELEGRLLSILRAEGERAPVSRRTATIAATIAFAMLLPIATVRLTAKPPSTDETAAHTTAGTSIEVSAEIDRDEDAIVMERAHFEQLVQQAVELEMQRGDEVRLVGDRKQKVKQYSSEGERWYAEAYELHGQERFDEAIAAFRKAIENDYRVGTSMYNIGCGYAMQGDVENAIRWIEDAFANGFTKVATVEKDADLDPIRSDPRFIGLLRDLRARHGVTGHTDRLEAARERFAEMRASGSTSAGAWNDVGVQLLRLRQLDDAVVALEESIRLTPDNPVAHYNLACAFALRGETGRALDSLEQSILAGFDGGTKMLNDPDLESIRSDARFETLRVMSDELSLWGGLKERKVRQAEKQAVKERWDEVGSLREAMPRFESAVVKYPHAGRAWFNLGYATIKTGSLDRARQAFERAIELDYKRATSTYNLACVEALAGNREEAFRHLYEAENAGAPLGMMKDDADLQSLRDDPRFLELLERGMKRDQEKKMKIEQMKAKQVGAI